MTHTYSTTSYSLTIARANSSYAYYIATTSQSTNLIANNTMDYSWTPTANGSVNIYVYQIYTITYADNTGYPKNSGTLPSTAYKTHGVSYTVLSNALTKTGYTSNGWITTNSTINSTPSYANSAVYTSNANLTLYANWIENTYSVNLTISITNNYAMPIFIIIGNGINTWSYSIAPNRTTSIELEFTDLLSDEYTITYVMPLNWQAELTSGTSFVESTTKANTFIFTVGLSDVSGTFTLIGTSSSSNNWSSI